MKTIASMPGFQREFAQPCGEPMNPVRRATHHARLLTRGQFAEAAAAVGAVLAFGTGSAAAPAWRERRDAYPQGVASGDPAPDSVILWTRRQPAEGDPRATYLLTVEVAKDPAFREVVERSETADGGPLRYRVRHRVNRWKAGEPSRLEQAVVEGNAEYSIWPGKMSR